MAVHAHIAVRAAERLGRRAAGLRFIRAGTNTVYALDRDLILRISDSAPASVAPLHQQCALARWLVDHDFPTSAPLGAPMDIAGHTVSVWQLLPGAPATEHDRRALGAAVRRFHALTDVYPGDLPEWDPLGRMGARLDVVASDAAFTEDDRALLMEWRDRLVPAARAMRCALPPGVLHGDIHLGNAMVSGGRLHLIDLDRICRGPRAWDLAQPLASTARCGGSMEDFIAGYGRDIRDLPGMDTLVRLRALFMTSWLLTIARTPDVGAEIQRRMAYWRGVEDPPRWQPF